MNSSAKAVLYVRALHEGVEICRTWHQSFNFSIKFLRRAQ